LALCSRRPRDNIACTYIEHRCHPLLILNSKYGKICVRSLDSIISRGRLARETTHVRRCLFINYLRVYMMFGSVSRRWAPSLAANQNISTRITAKSSIILGTSYARDSVCFLTNQTWSKVNTTFQTLLRFRQNNIIRLAYFNRLFAYYVFCLTNKF